MKFAHDTMTSLLLAAGLVNTEAGRADETDGLTDAFVLEMFLHDRQIVWGSPARPADLHAVRRLRPRLAAAWQAASRPPALAAIANDLLGQSGARLWLTDHDGTWHLHATRPDAPLVHRAAAQAGIAFADLVRLGETERLRQCLAPGCRAVLFDLSRNRSRMYCDTGNCGNRQHVTAYRARQASHENSSRPGSNSWHQ
jgi:predicted RNA-binding Zn ribbon-like protein